MSGVGERSKADHWVDHWRIMDPRGHEWHRRFPTREDAEQVIRASGTRGMTARAYNATGKVIAGA